MSESANSLSSVVRSRPSSGNLGCRLVLNAESPAVRCEVIGGNGGDGNPAGKGFPAIAYADGTELVPTVIGDNINVIHGIDGKDLHEDSGAFWVDGSVFIRAVDPAKDGKWAITFTLTLKEDAPAFNTWVNSTAKADKFKLKVAATADDLDKATQIDVVKVRSAAEGQVTFDCAIESAQLKYFKVVIED